MSILLVAASNQFLEVNSVPGGVTNYPITVSMSVQLVSDADMGLFWLGNRLVANAWLAALAVDSVNGFFYAQSRNTGTTAFAQSTTDPASTVGQWLNLGARMAANNSRNIVLNGTQQGSNTVVQNAPTLNRTSIGHFGDSTPALPANAYVAYAAMWSATLTDEEIAAVHAGVDPRNVQAAALEELWDFSSLTPLVGLIAGTTLVATGSPTQSPLNPSLPWLFANQGGVVGEGVVGSGVVGSGVVG